MAYTNDASGRPLAVVTGASSGIGLELAREFAEHDFDLFIVAEDACINAVADRLRSQGGRVEAMRANLADFEGVERFHQRLRALGRPVDAIAINAGVGVGGPFVDTDLREEINLINLNVTGTVHLAKLVLRDMVARGEGRVLFTASKAFVLSLAEALRNELEETGITVTALQPGPTETNFFHRAGMDDTKVGRSKKDDAAAVARQGFEALMAGKDHVVAGSVKNKVQSAVAQVTPETMKAAAHRKLSEPGSGEK